MRYRVALYCLLGGAASLVPAMGAGHALWWYVSGVVLAAAFVPVAIFGPRGFWSQFAVIFPVLFIISALTTWSEALLFVKAPLVQEHPFANLAGQTFVYLIVAIALSGLARLLKLHQGSSDSPSLHPWAKNLSLVVVCAFAYVFYYLVTGSITYQYFTKGYYPDVLQIVAPLGLWFWAIQLARGLLITLAVLPAVYTLRLARGKLAIYLGTLIWVAGGLALLLVPNELMGSTQRLIHIVEIFTQNFTLGVTAGLLLRRASPPGKQTGRAHDGQRQRDEVAPLRGAPIQTSPPV